MTWGAARNPAAAISGIVLAGGRSTRFGRDKLAMPLGGRPLLDHAVTALASVCQEIVIVIGQEGDVTFSVPAAESVPAAGSLSTVGAPTTVGSPIRVVRDPEPFGGPLVGLLAGLDVVASPMVLAAGGDMPTLRQPVLQLLVDVLAADEHADAVVLRHRGERRPLPMALRQGAAMVPGRRLLGLGERSLHAFLAALRTRDVAEDEWRALDPEADTLRDIDRPADLHRLERSTRE